MSATLLLLTGAFVFGTRHAFDPDHVAAVSAIAVDERRIRPVVSMSVLWGAGHFIPLLLLGLPILLLGLVLPPLMEHFVDLGVGLLLIGLGARALGRVRLDEMSDPAIASAKRGRALVLLVGMAHGLAGSGAVAMMALTAAPSVWSGVGYLLVFGLGTCAGMLAMSLCVTGPALSFSSRSALFHSRLQLLAGVASIGIGLYMWIDILPRLVY